MTSELFRVSLLNDHKKREAIIHTHGSPFLIWSINILEINLSRLWTGDITRPWHLHACVKHEFPLIYAYIYIYSVWLLNNKHQTDIALNVMFKALFRGQQLIQVPFVAHSCWRSVHSRPIIASQFWNWPVPTYPSQSRFPSLIIHYAWHLGLLTQCRPHRCIQR